MARVREVEKEGAPPEVRTFFERQEEVYGTVLNTARVVAHFPAWLQATAAVLTALEQSRYIGPDLRAIARIRVAQIIGCPF
jgi:alkylhydroperoxidase family enzyme